MTEYNSNGIVPLKSLDETRSRHAELLSLFQSQEALDKKLTYQEIVFL